jgi:RNA polymerase sigma-70 factor (ECF subfamily)
MDETTRLLDAALRGEREALEALYARHSGRLLAFIRASMPAPLARRVAPEDVLQETLLESARKIGEFEPRGSAAFYRWLVAIARFKLAETRRALLADKRAREEPLASSPAAEQTSPSGRAMRAEGALSIAEALGELPERQAEAVRLRYLEGLTLAETAERLECSEAAVKALVSRGLAELARHARIEP